MNDEVSPRVGGVIKSVQRNIKLVRWRHRQSGSNPIGDGTEGCTTRRNDDTNLPRLRSNKFGSDLGETKNPLPGNRGEGGCNRNVF